MYAGPSPLGGAVQRQVPGIVAYMCVCECVYWYGEQSKSKFRVTCMHAFYACELYHLSIHVSTHTCAYTHTHIHTYDINSIAYHCMQVPLEKYLRIHMPHTYIRTYIKSPVIGCQHPLESHTCPRCLRSKIYSTAC
jgi:hypothetical protein